MPRSLCQGPLSLHVHQPVPCRVLPPSETAPQEEKGGCPSPGRGHAHTLPQSSPSPERWVRTREVGANHGVTLPCTHIPALSQPMDARPGPPPAQDGPHGTRVHQCNSNLATMWSSPPCGETSVLLLTHARPSRSRRLQTANGAEQGLERWQCGPQHSGWRASSLGPAPQRMPGRKGSRCQLHLSKWGCCPWELG